MTKQPQIQEDWNKPLDTIQALEKILTKDKPSELFKENILEFYKARTPLYNTKPTFTQLVADYNQYQGQTALQTIKWNFDRSQRELEEIQQKIDEIKKQQAKPPQPDQNGLHIVSLDTETQEELRKLETERKRKESNLRNHYEQWVKLWDKIRTWEEKRLDRETTKKIQTTVMKLKPSDFAQFVQEQ